MTAIGRYVKLYIATPMYSRMPVSKVLPYQWYDTPNVHLCTLYDFEALCRDHGIAIIKRRVMSGERVVSLLPNLLGSTAVYRFQRGVANKP